MTMRVTRIDSKRLKFKAILNSMSQVNSLKTDFNAYLMQVVESIALMNYFN